MRLPDQHLSADELEELGKEEGLSGELGDQLRPAREHAASCPACRRRLDVYPTSGAKLEKLRALQAAKKGPDCPSVDIWLQVAGELLRVADQERYTKHAAQCDYCGPVLREVVQDFAEPMREDENSALEKLKSGEDIWAERADRTRASKVPPTLVLKPTRRRSWFGVPVWLVSAAVLVICAVMAISLFRLGIYKGREKTVPIDQLLARAYSEQRTIELRIPGATSSELKQKRDAPSQSLVLTPDSLIASEQLISRRLSKEPENQYWLLMQSRLDLLDWRYQAALSSISKAEKLGPENRDLLLDRALANYEVAESERLFQNYAFAVNDLSKVLRENPSDTVALFNRALIYERLGLLSSACSDWHRVEQLEREEGWFKEAQRHLAACEEKKIPDR